ncbi:hypothetical protein GMORB2_4435 [Geosmithia morbida]|uniref:Uncharacterized protein n=1 Tax=Geosmithia morbida TaxID=1094350 RepID=A0A9P4YQ73_9HYPO|nr:uncharacterized protein GMORB2_4435 [Geosmithia morbida]KAF4119769.1 hypothetical protein GMORB2_4435 [Geosmithia morbida]
MRLSLLLPSASLLPLLPRPPADSTRRLRSSLPDV